LGTLGSVKAFKFVFVTLGVGGEPPKQLGVAG